MFAQFFLVALVPVLVFGLLLGAWLLGLRYVSHSDVGVVEKLWSSSGSLSGGSIIAVRGEAGFQSRILRGGVHLGLFPWQYRVHKLPLVVIAENRIGYVYARDGEPLSPANTLGRVVPCGNFQDSQRFLSSGGQRGRQRDILREGVYAINLAQFVVITEDRIYSGPGTAEERAKLATWQDELRSIGGFSPVVVGRGRHAEHAPRIGAAEAQALGASDEVGIVTVHDGPAIESHQIIAPEVKSPGGGSDHNCFQEPELFLALGGRRGKQLQVLTDGTFFLNRWFATVEKAPKTLVPIGYVGVVVSYYGADGEDLSGKEFRYGAQVEEGQRGVWKHALPTGKYPLNPYALTVELVPTINFVLRWIDDRTEAHQYDKNLRSIELITADGYEPILPLSLVLHIDYENAPSVVQRFGDVERLITQTLDPILAAYFRDVAQKSNMLDLISKREEIQQQATLELGRRFREYDINCVAVLIGRPQSEGNQYQPGEDPIEHLLDQLRMRRLAEEQVGTYQKQKEAANQLRELNAAQAESDKQTELTQAHLDVEIAMHRGEATLAEAERLAKRDVVRAEGESRSRELLGKGEASRLSQVGRAEAAVFEAKVKAYQDPRFFALQEVSARLAESKQPLVPERLLEMSGGSSQSMPGMLGQLLSLLLAEKSGIAPLAGESAAARVSTDSKK
jgi:uncharacterized membrane protein YqiK